MFSPLLSVFLMGMIPVWGLAEGSSPTDLQGITVAPPAVHSPNSPDVRTLGTRLSASGILVADLESGQTVFARSIDTARPMASLTKLMTALLIVEQHDLDEVVTVPQDVADVAGNTVSLAAGDQLTVGDLLSALLIMSANDAAITLARYHSGSLSAFVEEMNARAQVLGMRSTVYANPTGLDAPSQQSSPRDLLWLTMYVLRHPPLAERMAMRGTQIQTLMGKKFYLTHTHAMLHAAPPLTASLLSTQPFVEAGKTGTTEAAGQCLLSIVRAGTHQYVAILLGSADRYGDMRAVLDALQR